MKTVPMWEIISTFFIIGSITIGGGPGGLAITQSYIVDKRNWITQEEMLDFITMGQSMPGVITVNISLFVGHKLRGYLGATLATIMVILPAFLSIVGIAVFLRPILELPLVQKAFSGIRIGVIGIIVNAAYRMGEVIKWNKGYTILGALSLVIFVLTNINPVILFIVGAFVGWLYFKNQPKQKDKEDEEIKCNSLT